MGLNTKVIYTIWKVCNNGENELVTKLFLRVCSKLLKTEFESHSQKGKSIVMSFYKLIETEELQALRNSIFDKIISLFANGRNQGDIEYLISKYPSGLGHRYAISAVEKWDVQNILDFVKKYFDVSSYTHCKIVLKLLKSFDTRSIEYDRNLYDRFKHPTYEIEKILLQHDSEIYLEGSQVRLDWDAFIDEYTFDDWNQLLETCIHIGKNQFREEYIFKNNLNKLFHILAEKDQKLYVDVFSKYLEMGNPLSLHLNIIDIIKIIGKERAYDLLQSYEYTNKERWLFSYFAVLPKEFITIYEAEQLLSLYKVCDIQAIPYHLGDMEHYVLVQPKILVNIVDTLIRRTIQENQYFVDYFEMIFNSHSDVFKGLDEYFKDEIDLLKKAYLLCMNKGNHFDYSLYALNKLIDLDNTFVEEFIRKLFEKDGYISAHDIQIDFTIIWNRDDFESIISRIIEAVYTIPLKKNVWNKGEILKAFFVYHDNRSDIDERADYLLKKYIDQFFTQKKRMIFIFELICEFDDQRRINLIAHILKKNDSFELFEKLSLEPNGCSWSGSRVPSLQKEIDFYKSLIQHMNSIKLLQHKQKMEQNISYLKKDIEREKKNDFMEDDY